MIRSMTLLAFGAVTVAASTAGPESKPFDPPPTDRGAVVSQDTMVSFSRDVFPIIQRSCLQCHGGTGDDGTPVFEAGLDMTTYENLMKGSEFGAVVEAGDPDGSMLVEMISVGDMPQEGDPLSVEEIALISRWVAQGAGKN